MQDLKTWSKTHKKWVDAFVLEMRALDVPGSVIGDQLTTVYTHCQETGETPEAAFGDAENYAHSLGYAPKEDTTSYARLILPSLVTLLAMFVFNYAISALANEHNFMLNWAVAAAWGVTAVLIASLVFIPFKVLAGNPYVLIGYAVACSMLGVAGVLFSRFDWKLIVDTPPTPVAVVSGVVMVAVAFMGSRAILIEENEPVTSPLDSEEKKQKERRNANRLGVLAAWILPIYSAISAIITLAF